MNEETKDYLLRAFLRCRDYVAQLRHEEPAGPTKGHLSDYLQLLFIIIRSVEAIPDKEEPSE